MKKNRALSLLLDSLETRRHFAVWSVDASGGGDYNNLSDAIFAASTHDGDTIQVRPGTYVAKPINESQALYFITKQLQIVSTGGPDVTTLTVPGNPGAQPAVLQILSDNTRIEGFTISGGGDTIRLGDFQDQTQTHILSGLVIANNRIIPDTFTGQTTGTAILVDGVKNSVIEDNTIAKSFLSGIYLQRGSTGNTVSHNTVNGTTTQNGIQLIAASNNNLIADNTITGAGFDGIQANGSNFNRFIGNTVTDAHVDGITMTDSSNFNYLAYNNVVFSVGSPNTAGAGIWFNRTSNYNAAYGNYVEGAYENGFAIFQSSYNRIEGNETTRNRLGGIFITRYDTPDRNANVPVPTGNVIINNYVHDDPNAAGINVDATSDTLIQGNFVNYTSNPQTGIQIRAAANTRVYNNTVVNPGAGIYIFADSTNTVVIRNRFLNPQSMFAIKGTTVAFDGGAVLGGNYYTSNPAPAGDPGSTAYTNFTFDGTLLYGYADAHPFASESLGLASDVSILSPVGGEAFGAGAIKTIRYYSAAASRVKIELVSPTQGTTVLAAAAPNNGVYRWNIANGLTASSDYTLVITPLNEAGTAIGASTTSAAFRLNSGIRLTSTASGERYVGGQAISVTWAGGGNPVNVEYDNGSGTWQTLATNVVGEEATVTLPATATTRGRLRVVDPTTGAIDTSDAFLTIQGGAGTVTGPAGTAAVGALVPISWTSPAATNYVKLEIVTPAGATTIVSTLVDTGSFRVSIPDVNSDTATVRVTYFDASGQSLGSASSDAFTISGTGAPITFYSTKQNPVLPTDGGGGGPVVTGNPDLTAVLTGTVKGGVVGGKKGKATIKITNAGTGNKPATGSLTADLYLTTGGEPGVGDSVLASIKPKNVTIKTGKSVSVPVSFVFPAGLADGQYTLFAKVNATGGISESNANNNLGSGIAPIAIEATRVNIKALSMTTPATFITGKKLGAGVTLQNTGNSTAAGTATIQLFASSDNVADAGDQLLATSASLKINLKANAKKVFKLNNLLAAGATANGAAFVYAVVVPAVTPADADAGDNSVFSATTVAIS